MVADEEVFMLRARVDAWTDSDWEVLKNDLIQQFIPREDLDELLRKVNHDTRTDARIRVCIKRAERKAYNQAVQRQMLNPKFQQNFGRF